VLAFKAIRQMKPMFVDAFNLALVVYPEAQVDVEATGLALHPSPPVVLARSTPPWNRLNTYFTDTRPGHYLASRIACN
jgi:hypothetical protein